MSTLDVTHGAYLIGVVLAAFLHGCTCLQGWYYYTHYPLDWWSIKLLVAVVLVLDTVHQALITHALYTYVITYFGDMDALYRLLWSPILAVYIGGFSTFFVQCFLAMRVYRLSRQNWLATGSAMGIAIAQLVMAVVYASKAIRLQTFVELAALKNFTMAINGISSAGDLLIATILCYLLHGSRTGFRRSDSLISRLIVFTVNTGLLTSICAIASLIFISAAPHTFIYMIFYFSVSRLYCNSLLTTLNARKELRSDSHDDDLSLESRKARVNHSFLATPSKRTPSNISIRIDTTQEYLREERSSSCVESKNPEVV